MINDLRVHAVDRGSRAFSGPQGEMDLEIFTQKQDGILRIDFPSRTRVVGLKAGQLTDELQTSAFVAMYIDLVGGEKNAR